jgi:AcrR family transcriptional regulator
MKKRPYRMTQRAESRDETRARIVEAAVALHEEIGPRATTISAIAERAGVQRLTVYRHLPDEEAVIQACSSHWTALNPAPDPVSWDSIGDPVRRVRTALREFCAYYTQTARMWASVRRDAADVPAVQVPLAAYDAYVEEVAEGLADDLDASKRARVQAAATLRHALSFTAWQNLEELGLDDAAKVSLVERWLDGIISR